MFQITWPYLYFCAFSRHLQGPTINVKFSSAYSLNSKNYLNKIISDLPYFYVMFNCGNTGKFVLGLLWWANNNLPTWQNLHEMHLLLPKLYPHRLIKLSYRELSTDQKAESAHHRTWPEYSQYPQCDTPTKFYQNWPINNKPFAQDPYCILKLWLMTLVNWCEVSDIVK